MNSSRSRKSAAARYPTRAQIGRAVQAARANGVAVGTIDIRRDGSIRVGVAAEKPATAAPSLFDELNAAGRL